MAAKHSYEAQVWKYLNTELYWVVVVQDGTRPIKYYPGLHPKPKQKEVQRLSYLPGAPKWWVNRVGGSPKYRLDAAYKWSV